MTAEQQHDKDREVKDLRYGDLCPKCNAASGIDTCGSADDECPIAVDVLPENYYQPRTA